MIDGEKIKEKITLGNIDIKWIVSLMLPIIAWGVSLEVRMSSGLPARIVNLEVALTPVLIEYGVNKELAARGLKSTVVTTPPPAIAFGPVDIKEEEKRIAKEVKEQVIQQFPNAKR